MPQATMARNNYCDKSDCTKCTNVKYMNPNYSHTSIGSHNSSGSQGSGSNSKKSEQKHENLEPEPEIGHETEEHKDEASYQDAYDNYKCACCNPDVYKSILGPTPDEGVLALIQYVLGLWKTAISYSYGSVLKCCSDTSGNK